ncbi:MAG: hypothetical protein LBU88_08240 [Treponema sp.]|jgi:hypothetical protein|nr:hypothetical protein [Treponema sp.]
MKKITLLFVFYFIISASIFAQLRAFNDIFPAISTEVRTSCFSENGNVSYHHRARGITLLANQSSGIDPLITNNVLNKNSGYVIETIKVIPVNSSGLTMLDIYNALGNIRGLKGRLYSSSTRGRPTPLFEEATRITSSTQTSAIPDPAPALSIPASETIFIRLKDANFGNTFYRAEVAPTQNGLRYSLTNYRNINYLFVTVIKQEQFTAQLYIEPIREGLLIYCIAGFDISDFASARIQIESAITKRLGVITGWASDEILKKVNR